MNAELKLEAGLVTEGDIVEVARVERVLLLRAVEVAVLVAASVDDVEDAGSEEEELGLAGRDELDVRLTEVTVEPNDEDDTTDDDATVDDTPEDETVEVSATDELTVDEILETTVEDDTLVVDADVDDVPLATEERVKDEDKALVTAVPKRLLEAEMEAVWVEVK